MKNIIFALLLFTTSCKNKTNVQSETQARHFGFFAGKLINDSQHPILACGDGVGAHFCECLPAKFSSNSSNQDIDWVFSADKTKACKVGWGTFHRTANLKEKCPSDWISTNDINADLIDNISLQYALSLNCK